MMRWIRARSGLGFLLLDERAILGRYARYVNVGFEKRIRPAQILLEARIGEYDDWVAMVWGRYEERLLVAWAVDSLKSFLVYALSFSRSD